MNGKKVRRAGRRIQLRLESLSGREWQTVHVTRSPLIGWGDQSSIEPITDPRKG